MKSHNASKPLHGPTIAQKPKNLMSPYPLSRTQAYIIQSPSKSDMRSCHDSPFVVRLRKFQL
jgi:hypothetical protein